MQVNIFVAFFRCMLGKRTVTNVTKCFAIFWLNAFRAALSATKEQAVYPVLHRITVGDAFPSHHDVLMYISLGLASILGRW